MMANEHIWIPFIYDFKGRHNNKLELTKDNNGKIVVFSEYGEIMAICKDGDLLMATLTNLHLGYFD